MKRPYKQWQNLLGENLLVWISPRARDAGPSIGQAGIDILCYIIRGRPSTSLLPPQYVLFLYRNPLPHHRHRLCRLSLCLF